MADNPITEDATPLDKSATIDKWWDRLLEKPVYVCLVLSLLYNFKQDRRLDARDEQHRTELRESRQEVNKATAERQLAERERDVSQEKLIESQRREIDALNRHGAGSKPQP